MNAPAKKTTPAAPRRKFKLTADPRSVSFDGPNMDPALRKGMTVYATSRTDKNAKKELFQEPHVAVVLAPDDPEAPIFYLPKKDLEEQK